jgi:hypothetical protein
MAHRQQTSHHVALKYSVNCTQLKDLELDVCQPNLCGLTIIIAQ